jgi:hypothetical protein
MSPVTPPPEDSAALHATFRPRRGRRVATWIGLTQGVLFTAIAVLMPSDGPAGLGVFDRLGFLAFGGAIGTLLWRFARLAVFVDDAGLRVRNLAADRLLEWAEVVTVRFGGGHPWVTLDLADGEPFAVMAIQRADGPFAEAEARRLATLVALHSPTDRNS